MTDSPKRRKTKKKAAAVDSRVLEELFQVIDSRRTADPATSYTAKLFAAGRPKIAQKLGEEAVETLLEGISGDRERLASESADLLYHLLVMWSACGLRPEDVWSALEARVGVSGIDEKKRRKLKD
jgi:phosphoribosyl-ATP pyrophosphohydrolase